MSAVFFIVSNIDSIESSMGRTKHAESCWSGLPAFIKVGELGRKRRDDISSKKPFAVVLISFSDLP